MSNTTANPVLKQATAVLAHFVRKSAAVPGPNKRMPSFMQPAPTPAAAPAKVAPPAPAPAAVTPGVPGPNKNVANFAKKEAAAVLAHLLNQTKTAATADGKPKKTWAEKLENMKIRRGEAPVKKAADFTGQTPDPEFAKAMAEQDARVKRQAAAAAAKARTSAKTPDLTPKPKSGLGSGKPTSFVQPKAKTTKVAAAPIGRILRGSRGVADAALATVKHPAAPWLVAGSLAVPKYGPRALQLAGSGVEHAGNLMQRGAVAMGAPTAPAADASKAPEPTMLDKGLTAAGDYLTSFKQPVGEWGAGQWAGAGAAGFGAAALLYKLLKSRNRDDYSDEE